MSENIIPLSSACFRYHWTIIFIFVWLRITGEGLLPKVRIWFILINLSDLKWCIHLSIRLFLYCNGFMPTEDAYSSRHVALSHFETCNCFNVESYLSWTCLVSSLLIFEHPSVLLFCFLKRCATCIIFIENYFHLENLTRRILLYKVFGGVFYVRRWRGFCHRTESDFFLFLYNTC